MANLNPPLNPPKPSNPTAQQMADWLAVFYASTSLGPYSRYLCLHSYGMDDFQQDAGSAEQHADQLYPVTKFSNLNSAVVLNLQSLTALQTITPFIGDGELFHVFVQIDDQNLLPFQSSALLSQSFVNGLLTRLILEKYNRNWGTLGLNSTLNLNLQPVTGAAGLKKKFQPATPSPFYADVWAANYVTTYSAMLQAAKSWPATDYPSALSQLTDATLQAVGIIQGWIAGDALSASTATADWTACDSVIWKWLNSRYTCKQLGLLMGYTFCYLSGYLRCERTIALIQEGKDPGSVMDVPTLFRNLTNHCHGTKDEALCTADPVFRVANKFFELVSGEFYVTQPTNTLAALANHQAFLIGFEEGLTLGADSAFTALFADAYKYGYNAGYTSGFRDGYSQGYAAGYRAGYSAGYSAGQPNWLTGLNTVVSDIGNLIGDARTITTILSSVSTVGTVLAAIF